MATPRATHLWVFVHGLHGTPQDFAYMTETLKSQHAKQEAEERTNDATRLRHVYLLSKCNAHLTGTMDGVDRAGERLEAEILAEMEACRRQSSTRHDDESSEAADPTCTSSSAASASPAARPCGGGERAPQQAPHRVLLSLVGHSLGGLIARFAAGQLAARGVFDGGRCVPCNFVTIGTPHLGSRDWRVVPFAPTIVSRVLGRTGRQLMLCDGQASATLEERNSTEGGACTQSNKGTPLLARLANGTYREAWASFPRRLVVACPHDLKVGFLSARLSRLVAATVLWFGVCLVGGCVVVFGLVSIAVPVLVLGFGLFSLFAVFAVFAVFCCVVLDRMADECQWHGATQKMCTTSPNRCWFPCTFQSLPACVSQKRCLHMQ
eukprot:m.201409 g.201409  ORF g.201409 m.201409 type:complete len:379 (+) comp18419_c1_seq5:764-1900(+)